MWSYEQFSIDAMNATTDIGILVWGKTEGTDQHSSYSLEIKWDEANYSRDLAVEYVKDLQIALQWLTDNANLENNVSGLIKRLNNKTEKAAARTEIKV